MNIDLQKLETAFPRWSASKFPFFCCELFPDFLHFSNTASSHWLFVNKIEGKIKRLFELGTFTANKIILSRVVKDGAHYCYCAHFLRMPKQSRATRKKCATRSTRGLILSPVSLGGSSYFLWKRCVVFQQMKNNSIYLVSSLETEEVCVCCYFYV